MKLLHVINSLATGGAERLVLETLPLYAAQGIKVNLLLLNGEKHPFYKELLQQNCCSIYTLGNGPIYSIKNIFKLITYLKKYDLIHVHLFPAQYFVVVANWLAGSKNKLIFTEHNTSNRRMDSPFLGFFDRIFYKNYYRIVTISSGVRIALLNHIGTNEKNRNKIITIQNGVNIAKYSAQNFDEDVIDQFNKKDIFYLAQVAGFRPEKDQDAVIRALATLPSNVHLLLVGDGVRKKELINLVNTFNLQERVHFLGIRQDVYNIFKVAKIIVVSSHVEGFGLAAVEAMAAGRPVVASDIPGVSQVVENAGLLFQKNNSQDLAEKITSLIADQNFYDSTVEKCRERAKKYDIRNMVDLHIQLYKSLL